VSGGSPARRRRLRETALRASAVAYALLLLIAGWPQNLLPERAERLSLSVRLLLLDRVGIQPGRPVFSGTRGLPKWWTRRLCLRVTARPRAGGERVGLFACPSSGLRVAWDPVDSMLYHWLIEARSSTGPLREARLGAGGHWFCGAERWGGDPVSHVRIESVEEEIEYASGSRRERSKLELEVDCG